METEIINISKSESKEEIYSKLTEYYKNGKKKTKRRGNL